MGRRRGWLDGTERAGDPALSEWRGLTGDLAAAPPVPDSATADDYLDTACILIDETTRRWRGRTER